MDKNRRFNFTDSAIKKLRPENSRVEYVDTSRKGLRLRITPTGTKSFIYRYKFNGRSRLLTFGEYGIDLSLEEANQKLSIARVQIKNKNDPGEIKQHGIKSEKAEPLIPDLIIEYIERHAKPNKKTWKYDQAMLEKDVLPRWKYKKAKDIKTRDIVLLLDKVEKRSVSTRNHLHSILSKMFKFAVNNRAMIDQSPCIGIDRVKEATRERWLYDFEICIFWYKLETASMNEYMKTGLKLLLVTGQRRGELSSALWKNVDLDKAEWFLPDTKNGQEHLVPLSKLAVKLFKQLKEQTRESAYVLPTPHLHATGADIPAIDKPVTERALTRALANNRDYFELEHFTPHDLRRTMVTKMNELKIDSKIVERVVNHLPPKIERTYNHYDYFSEKQAALEVWAEELIRITARS
jgi:integrase